MIIKTSLFSLHTLIIVLVLIKVSIILFSDNNLHYEGTYRLEKSLQNAFTVNPDELSIAKVAYNYNKGLGYVSDGDYGQGKMRKTAWRPTFPVWIHILMLQAYQKMYPNHVIRLNTLDPYFTYYGFFLQILYVCLYTISLYYLYELGILIFNSPLWAKGTLVAYSFMPSVCYYIGSMPCYENIAISCLIVVIGLYCKLMANKAPYNAKSLIMICIFSAIACLLRPQILIIMLCIVAFIFCVALFSYRKHIFAKKRVLLVVAVFNLVFLSIVHIPILIKNYRLFNAIILSTQDGYELLQGHNPLARGAWNGNWYKGTEYDKYVRANIVSLDTLNEFEEGAARKKLAFTWIAHHPQDEFILILRKTAMFFLPDNYLHFKEINFAFVYNAFVFALFITGSIVFTFNFILNKYPWTNFKWILFIMLPVIASLFMSIIFFVGHRWRYYAEPFMLILAIKYILLLLSSQKQLSENKYFNV